MFFSEEFCHAFFLLRTYSGLSIFTFERFCTGRKLQVKGIRERDLIIEDISRRHSRDNYVHEWFEVKEGDQIRVVRMNDDDSDINQTFIVTVDLPEPPFELDDKKHRTGMGMNDYLVKHCAKLT